LLTKESEQAIQVEVEPRGDRSPRRPNIRNHAIVVNVTCFHYLPP